MTTSTNDVVTELLDDDLVKLHATGLARVEFLLALQKVRELQRLNANLEMSIKAKGRKK